ncbi:MAG: ABC transporter permease [Oscillospiraceae bacterium]
MTAVYKRELRSYFSSMIGYVFIAAMTVFVGLFFSANNLELGYPYFAYTIESVASILILAIPILTMKSIAEEKKAKTDQMLLTYPVSVTSVIMGKYLSMMTIYIIPLIISCFCPIIIAAVGQTSYILGDYLAIFAMLCMGALFVAIGMFISSLTENQIIAAVGSMVALLLIYFWDDLVKRIPTTSAASLIGLLAIIIIIALVFSAISHNQFVSIITGLVGGIIIVICYVAKSSMFSGLINTILGAFSCMGMLQNFTRYNSFDLGGIFLYLSLAAMFVFLTVQSVQKRRWS